MLLRALTAEESEARDAALAAACRLSGREAFDAGDLQEVCDHSLGEAWDEETMDAQPAVASQVQ